MLIVSVITKNTSSATRILIDVIIDVLIDFSKQSPMDFMINSIRLVSLY